MAAIVKRRRRDDSKRRVSASYNSKKSRGNGRGEVVNIALSAMCRVVEVAADSICDVLSSSTAIKLDTVQRMREVINHTLVLCKTTNALMKSDRRIDMCLLLLRWTTIDAFDMFWEGVPRRLAFFEENELEAFKDTRAISRFDKHRKFDRQEEARSALTIDIDTIVSYATASRTNLVPKGTPPRAVYLWLKVRKAVIRSYSPVGAWNEFTPCSNLTCARVHRHRRIYCLVVGPEWRFSYDQKAMINGGSGAYWQFCQSSVHRSTSAKHNDIETISFCCKACAEARVKALHALAGWGEHSEDDLYVSTSVAPGRARIGAAYRHACRRNQFASTYLREAIRPSCASSEAFDAAMNMHSHALNIDIGVLYVAWLRSSGHHTRFNAILPGAVRQWRHNSKIYASILHKVRGAWQSYVNSLPYDRTRAIVDGSDEGHPFFRRLRTLAVDSFNKLV